MIVNNNDSQKFDNKIETYESTEELKYTKKNMKIIVFFKKDDLNEKEINNDRIQAMGKRGRHNNLSVFVISQDYYEIPKRTIRANVNNFDIFKPNNFSDVRNIYEDKTSMDMTLDEFKYLASTCWDGKYQPLTIDMTKDEFTGRYR